MKIPSSLIRTAGALALGLSCLGAQAGAYDDLIAAAYKDDAEAVNSFLVRGMDVNTVDPAGNTLLHIAARNGNLALIDTLLKKKANPLVRNRVGDTPLMLAAYAGKSQAVDKLLAGGAQLNHDGWTPLHYAVYSGQSDITRHLVVMGASIDARAPNQQTPLMLAAAAGNANIVKVLLEGKADTALKDQNGNTALDLAKNGKNSDVVNLLQGQRIGQAVETPKVAAAPEPAKPVEKKIEPAKPVEKTPEPAKTAEAPVPAQPFMTVNYDKE